jgi:glycosyltransferase involved in cell wall biosynthesis
MLLLLLFNSDSGKGNIPGKVFEYLASRKPILAFGPERGDSAEIVEECGGFYHRYEEGVDAIKEHIVKVFKGELRLSSNIDQYSRKNLSGKLARYLEEITAAE